MNITTLKMIAGLCLMLSQPVQATLITGSISFSDGFDDLPQGGPSIVSLLSAFNVNNVINTYAPGSATDDFVGTSSALSFDFSLLALPMLAFSTDSGFSFTFTGISLVNVVPLNCTDALCTDAVQFSLAGIVSHINFDDTLFSGRWTANGVCLASGQNCAGASASGSWSASLVASGQAVPPRNEVPAPAAWLLLMTGLGLIALKRRSQAKQLPAC